jgi:hypothetical protein
MPPSTFPEDGWKMSVLVFRGSQGGLALPENPSFTKETIHDEG